MEAFAALGLNGQKATQMFAAGGQSAQVAFAEVVKRLSEMEDPVARNAAGVALFGTQFEDLEVKALEGFKAIQGSLPQIEEPCNRFLEPSAAIWEVSFELCRGLYGSPFAGCRFRCEGDYRANAQDFKSAGSSCASN